MFRELPGPSSGTARSQIPYIPVTRSLPEHGSFDLASTEESNFNKLMKNLGETLETYADEHSKILQDCEEAREGFAAQVDLLKETNSMMLKRLKEGFLRIVLLIVINFILLGVAIYRWFKGKHA